MNATAAFNALYDRQVGVSQTAAQTAAIDLGVAAGRDVIAMRLNDNANATAVTFGGKPSHVGHKR